MLLGDGLTAEFRGEGMLLINGVVVRKGRIGPDHWRWGRWNAEGKASIVEVRRRIYEGLKVVSGG